jgi:hypothetical protein
MKKVQHPKWSLSILNPSLLMTKGYDHNLMHKALSQYCISLFLRWRFLSLQVAIGETLRWSWINSLESWCIDGPDLFVNSHLVVPMMKGLITPSHDSQDSKLDSDRRSRSKLDLMAKIKPRSDG